MTTCCVDSNLQTHEHSLNWLRKIATDVLQWWQLGQQRRAGRRAIVHLQSLNDATLRDIGVHRGDVEWASHLPKSVDATAELELLARGYKARRNR
ncbi:MAG: DUF1127 domain-containing protein [Pseudomonadota bacterium]